MSCTSGNSSGPSQIQNSGSDEDPQQIMDLRKRKRMISNRESARRSRMKKQKHLDDMMAQVNQVKNENNQILTNINLTNQLYLNIESENSVLRAQLAELSHRLESLNDIINCLNATTNSPVLETQDSAFDYQMMSAFDHDFFNPWNLLSVNQPIMASPDVLMY
ncbi:bZIP transcription factor 11-like [Coffea eugenioides]|uniref:bZIP transcription factor 11-like n=1 Tax=Coffea eugenioides TaxID=49369 RepID=UPI000F608EA8|nr:bZIP transcription factor 11-like [Coffea eugenioides]XP_027179549.1 bZIP transcription factor 11-like [Coffea eugenioides]